MNEAAKGDGYLEPPSGSFKSKEKFKHIFDFAEFGDGWGALARGQEKNVQRRTSTVKD